MELDEDLTPGRTEVNPTSYEYQRKREKQGRHHLGFASQRLKSFAKLASRRNIRRKVPLKLKPPPRHTVHTESLQESRKLEIVKSLHNKAKKKNSDEKFEPNPELQTTFVRSSGDQ